MQPSTGRITCLATLVGAATAMTMILVVLCAVGTSEVARGVPQAPAGSPPKTDGPEGDRAGSPRKDTPPQAKVKLGLSINEPGRFAATRS